MPDKTSPAGVIQSIQPQGHRSTKVLFLQDGEETPRTYRIWPAEQDGTPNPVYQQISAMLNHRCQFHYYEHEGTLPNGNPYISKMISGVATGGGPNASQVLDQFTSAPASPPRPPQRGKIADPTPVGEDSAEVLRSAALMAAVAYHQKEVGIRKLMSTVQKFHAWMLFGGSLDEAPAEQTPPQDEPHLAAVTDFIVHDDEPF